MLNKNQRTIKDIRGLCVYESIIGHHRDFVGASVPVSQVSLHHMRNSMVCEDLIPHY